MALFFLWPKPVRFIFRVSQLRIDACAAFCGRYGCKLSQKMFVGKEYVLKHVRNKHTAVMEAMQEEVLHTVVTQYSSHCERDLMTEAAVGIPDIMKIRQEGVQDVSNCRVLYQACAITKAARDTAAVITTSTSVNVHCASRVKMLQVLLIPAA